MALPNVFQLLENGISQALSPQPQMFVFFPSSFCVVAFENTFSCWLGLPLQLRSEYKDAENVMEVARINRPGCRPPKPSHKGEASQAFVAAGRLVHTLWSVYCYRRP